MPHVVSATRRFSSKSLRANGLALVALGLLLAGPARADKFLVTNYDGDTVTLYDGNGTLVGNISNGLDQPNAVIVAGSGNIFVSNGGDDSISQYTPDLSFVGTFADTHLDNPVGMIFSTSGNLLVASHDDDLVVEFDPTGAFVGNFISTDLFRPTGLAFGTSGNLFVTNFASELVQEFDPSGAFVGTFAGNGLFQPTGLQFGLSGNLFVSNIGDFTISQFDSDGNFAGIFASVGLNEPLAFTFSNSGNLFAVNAGNNTVSEYDPTGAYVGTFTSDGLDTPTYITYFASPVFSQQPANQSVSAGTGATFTVAANGNVTFQWQRQAGGTGNFTDLTNTGAYSGVTTATLTVSATTLSMTGDRFQCVATNFGGPSTSNTAALTITSSKPTIKQQPQPATVEATHNIKFRVTATGPGPFTYAWQRNQVNLKNGPRVFDCTTAILTLRRVVFADAGNYRVVITNANGSSTSQSAKLTVRPIGHKILEP